METKFTEQESLQMITQMIQQAQNNFKKGAGNLTIYWGCLLTFIVLLHFALAFVIGNKAAFVWVLMLPGWIVASYIQKRIVRSAIVKTPIERVINYTWVAFGISTGLLQLVFWAMYYHFGTFQQFVMEAPLILIMSGGAQLISGIAYRFRPFIIGGIIFWVGAIACLLILPQVLFHLLIMAICMIFAYIVPGLRLNKKAKENV